MVVQLWKDIENWISTRLQINICFDRTTKLLGYPYVNDLYWPLKVGKKKFKKEIQKKNSKLNIFELQCEIKRKYFEQKYVAKLNSTHGQFKKRWTTWENLLENI